MEPRNPNLALQCINLTLKNLKRYIPFKGMEPVTAYQAEVDGISSGLEAIGQSWQAGILQPGQVSDEEILWKFTELIWAYSQYNSTLAADKYAELVDIRWRAFSSLDVIKYKDLRDHIGQISRRVTNDVADWKLIWNHEQPIAGIKPERHRMCSSALTMTTAYFGQIKETTEKAEKLWSKREFS